MIPQFMMIQHETVAVFDLLYKISGLDHDVETTSCLTRHWTKKQNR